MSSSHLGPPRPDYYVIDFDSTFTQVEALDELVKIARADDPNIKGIVHQIEELTRQAMEGRLSFQESLEQRVSLLKANKSHLKALIKVLHHRISPSFSRNRAFFKLHAEQVFIVSGGFKEFIIPVLRPFHILEKNVFANTFTFDPQGTIAGFDKTNPLSQEGGKVMLIRQWNLPGQMYGIGDGHSDYQLKESGLIKKFFAFTENIFREQVTQKADHVVPNFDEFLYINQLPRAISYPKNRILALFVGDFPESMTQIFKKDGLSVRVKPTFEEKYRKDVGLLVLDGKQAIMDTELRQAVKLKVLGIVNSAEPLLVSREICSQMGIVLFQTATNKLKIPTQGEKTLNQMVDFINKGSTRGSVNFPSLQMPTSVGVHRMLHIHQNVPGVIANINAVMAKHHLNIESQFLKTNRQLGYVITDVDARYDKAVLKDLREIEYTIKFRVLY